jgi:hypothetical protein
MEVDEIIVELVSELKKQSIENIGDEDLLLNFLDK